MVNGETVFVDGLGFSVAPSLQAEFLRKRSGGRRRRRPPQQSTLATPTPSASQLIGTEAEKQAQIQAFQTGGQGSFTLERAKAERRISQQQIQSQLQRETQQAQIRSQTVAGQLESAPPTAIGLPTEPIRLSLFERTRRAIKETSLDPFSRPDKLFFDPETGKAFPQRLSGRQKDILTEEGFSFIPQERNVPKESLQTLEFFIPAIGQATSTKRDPEIVDIGAVKSGELSIGGATTRPASLRTKLISVGLVIGGAGRVARGGSAVTQANIEQAILLAGKQSKGVRAISGGRVTDITTGFGKTEGTFAIQRGLTVTELASPTKALSLGRQEVIVTGKTFFKQEPFIIASSKAVVAETRLTPVGSKLTFGVSKIATKPRFDFVGVGTGKQFRGRLRGFGAEPFSRETVTAGFGAEAKGFSLGTGGRLGLVSKFELEAPGIKAFQGTGIAFPRESTSILKIIRTGGRSERGFSSFRGRGFGTVLDTKLSQIPQFKLPKTKIQPPSSFASAISRPTPALDVGIQRGLGGTGLTPRQIERGQGLVPPTVTTKTRDGLGFDTRTLGKIDVGLAPKIKGRGRQIDTFAPKLADLTIQQPRTAPRQKAIPKLDVDTKQIQKQIQRQAQPTSPRGDPFRFDPRLGLGGGGFILPKFPSLGGVGTRGRRVRRRRARVPIRPSLTGIILDIQTGIPKTAFIGGIDVGILPGQIRGVPKKKKKKKGRKGSKSGSFSFLTSL